jgi:hypothetical protein
MPIWRGLPVVRKTDIHAKFSLNSTNNLNYKGTSPEFIDGQRKKTKTKNKNKKQKQNIGQWCGAVGALVNQTKATINHMIFFE